MQYVRLRLSVFLVADSVILMSETTVGLDGPQHLRGQPRTRKGSRGSEHLTGARAGNPGRFLSSTALKLLQSNFCCTCVLLFSVLILDGCVL